MAKNRNNKSKIIHNSVFLSLCSALYVLRSLLSANRSKVFALCSVLLALSFVFCWILYPDNADSGPYLDSAHGNSSYGVKRNTIGFPSDYTRGLCAHCHEQHASIGGTEPVPTGGPDKYELFKELFVDQTEILCYSCHRNNPSPIQESMPLQYSYSYLAGGAMTITCPQSISQAFRFIDANGISQSNGCGSTQGSAHFLNDIRTFLRNQSWGFGSNTTNIDPCSGCHNPHMAQRDPHTSGNRGWVVSRPSQHDNADNNAWGLWGDNLPAATERMNNYAISAGGIYQSPCYYPWGNPCVSFEPDGSATTNGSNLFDTVTFCLDCHNQQIIGSNGTVSAINWSPSGDVHGGAPSQTCCDKGDKKVPYMDGINYVLSCLDCHEPHGSPNEYLLRQDVNGTIVPNFDTHLYYNLCLSCHTNLNTKHLGHIPRPSADTDCWGCHQHGDYSFPEPLGCTSCPGIYVKTF